MSKYWENLAYDYTQRRLLLGDITHTTPAPQPSPELLRSARAVVAWYEAGGAFTDGEGQDHMEYLRDAVRAGEDLAEPDIPASITQSIEIPLVQAAALKSHWAQLPTDPLAPTSICPECKLWYAHDADCTHKPCDECKLVAGHKLDCSHSWAKPHHAAPQGQQSGPFCWYCLQHGHVAADCPIASALPQFPSPVQIVTPVEFPAPPLDTMCYWCLTKEGDAHATWCAAPPSAEQDVPF